MRNRYLVSYDISNDRRLRNVHKKMKAFGLRVQLSVFECELSPRELALMHTALDGLIHHEEDQVLIVDLGPSEGRGAECVRTLGMPHVPVERRAVVV